MSNPSVLLDPEAKINDIIRACPGALPVLTRYDLDSCCSGALPLRVAAQRRGVALDRLTADLECVLREEAAG
jgi:iron-sulfur cluster repair protein YtfE (RIC family)